MAFSRFLKTKLANVRNMIQQFFYHRKPYKTPVDRIEFFSIVLNGMPFIHRQYENFKLLEVPWRWHVVEGGAELKKDSAWSLKFGGFFPSTFHKEGKSVDGTTEYLDSIAGGDPERVLVYRKPAGSFWQGKGEMCRAFVPNLRGGSLLWQIDIDEFWKPWQIETMFEMFRAEPSRTGAWFKCNFFAGPRVAVRRGEPYTQNWLRVWRFEEGMDWVSHVPPKLARKDILGCSNLGRLYPFTMEETEEQGLVFDHFAYVFPNQVKFKESFYGYRGLYEAWEKIEEWESFPENIRTFFPVGVEDQLVEKRDAEFFSSEVFLEWNSRERARQHETKTDRDPSSE